MKKIVEKMRESKFLTVMSFLIGIWMSVHPVYYLAASYFVYALFNILLMSCVFTAMAFRGGLNSKEDTVKLAKSAWKDCLEDLILVYCVAATIGYVAGQLFLMIF
jgi:ABC-type transporter Mla maintaining outer membrane lipid asymmetry permease subunit MlaE